MKRNDPTWNPWHGCHKISEGCKNCFMFYLDEQRKQDGSIISKNKTDWNLPLKKDKQGNYKIKSGEFVRVCMSSDFFIEEADEWREEAWDIMRKRSDVTFSLLTKRADRIEKSLPKDWGDGWDNITFAVSCENQKRADERIPYLLKLPAKHIWISLKPFIGKIDLDKYLSEKKIETVLCGGENYAGERPLHYEWVKKIYEQCMKYDVEFIFGQTGNVFIKDDKVYHIKDYKTQIEQALSSGLQNRKNLEKDNIEEPRYEQLTFIKDKTKISNKDILEFVKKQNTAIISSLDEEGYPWSRALVNPKYILDNDIYFATYVSSNKVRHFNNNSKACVYFYEKGKNYQGVMIKGNIKVLTDKKTKEKFWQPFYNAPVVLVVLANKDIPTYIYDGSVVMENMMLAACSLGLGSCWIHRAKETFETEEGKQILSDLNIDGNYEGIANCIIGYPNIEPTLKPRKEKYIYKI